MPFKKKRVRAYQPPWMSNELLRLIDRREYLAKQYRKCPCDLHQYLRDKARQDCVKLNNDLKRNYIEKSLERHKDNPKKIWRSIRELWPATKKKSCRAPKCPQTQNVPGDVLRQRHFVARAKAIYYMRISNVYQKNDPQN